MDEADACISMSTIKSSYTDKEYINIAEEVSDVFIYTTRLAERCHINLSLCISDYISACATTHITPISIYHNCIEGNEWHSLSFESLDQTLTAMLSLEPAVISSPTPAAAYVNSKSIISIKELKAISKSPRRLCLTVQKYIGMTAGIFAKQMETRSTHGLNEWSDDDKIELSNHLSSVVILLSVLSKLFQYQLSSIIMDKFIKNERKYPAELVKGSSKKYNEYRNNATASNSVTLNKSDAIAYSMIIALSSILIGLALGKRSA